MGIFLTMYNKNKKESVLETKTENIKTPKVLLIFNILASIFYISWWFNIKNIGHPLLYACLFLGEIYHVLQTFGFAVTVWNQKREKYIPVVNPYPVDIFITVC